MSTQDYGKTKALTSSGKTPPRRRKREPLTRTEREILSAVERAIREHGQPSVREITAAAGPNYYSSTTHRYLVRLVDKGYIEMTRKFRGIRLLPNSAKKEATR